MQINRLNPQPTLASPSAAPLSAANELLTEANSAAGVRAGQAQRTAPVLLTNPVEKPTTEAAVASEGVRLELDSASRAVDAGVYTRDGVVPTRMPPMLQTPAEQFVHSAVKVMREFETNAGAGTQGALSSASRAAAAAFGGVGMIKQAVSKLNVFA
jgi:hypothetical protein